jgi:hypothetical protein
LYKKFNGTYTGDFKINYDKQMSYNYQDKYYIIDSSFKVVDSVFCKNGLIEDDHDMQILSNGHFLLLGEEKLQMDLSKYHLFRHNGTAGSAKAWVTCGVIQEQDKNKSVVFEWHAKDHFGFDDVDSCYLNSPDTVDWTHFNSIERDNDGNILVSSKHFNEVTKLNGKTGAIIWRLGGNKNEFEFKNDPRQFKQQHDVRQLANGHLTLLDNGSDKAPFHVASVKEYQIDEQARMVNLVWNYVEDTNDFSDGIGGVQRLLNGNTLIDYGGIKNENILMNVVKPNGQKVFEIAFTDTLASYRAYNYPSLPWKLNRPQITCICVSGECFLSADKEYKEYLWSNGETARSITVSAPGIYSVFVPIGDGWHLGSDPFQVINMINFCSPLR